MCSDQLWLHLWMWKVGEYNIYHKFINCAIGHGIESRPQSDTCSPDSGRIMEYEDMKHNSKACLRYDKILFIKVWFMFCCCHCSTVSNSMICWAALLRYPQYYNRGVFCNKGFRDLILLSQRHTGRKQHKLSGFVIHELPDTNANIYI